MNDGDARARSAARTVALAVGLLCALMVLLLSRSVFAEPLPRIAIVRDADADADTDTRASQRLRAELESLGFEVIETSASGLDPEKLEQTARDVGAIAAVQLSPSRGSVEIWIVDRVTGKTVQREFVVPTDEAPDELVALRAVELLRASLIELGLPAAPRGEVKPPAAVKRLIPPPPRPSEPISKQESLALGLGPALAFSPGGAPPSIQARLGARLRLSTRFGAHALVLLPTLPATVEGREGSADLSLALFAAGIDLSLLPRYSSWRVRTGVSGGLVYLRAVGSAQLPFAADTQARAVGVAIGRMEFLYGVSRSVWLGAELLGGFLPQRVIVSFAGREVTSFGPAFGGAAVLLEVTVP